MQRYFIRLVLAQGYADVSLQGLIQDRFPLPRFIVCDAGGSQARFLLSKLNPSTTHTTGAYGNVSQSAQTIFTDDVSLQTFMDHLMK
jgi:protein transport protein SEC23